GPRANGRWYRCALSRGSLRMSSGYRSRIADRNLKNVPLIETAAPGDETAAPGETALNSLHAKKYFDGKRAQGDRPVCAGGGRERGHLRLLFRADPARSEDGRDGRRGRRAGADRARAGKPGRRARRGRRVVRVG